MEHDWNELQNKRDDAFISIARKLEDAINEHDKYLRDGSSPEETPEETLALSMDAFFSPDAFQSSKEAVHAIVAIKHYTNIRTLIKELREIRNQRGYSEQSDEAQRAGRLALSRLNKHKLNWPSWIWL